MNLLRMLFDFRGRINRARFWLTVLIWFVVCVLIAGAATNSFDAVFFLILIACIPAGIKRLHDRNKSAWWLLAFFGAPILLVLASAMIGIEASFGATILQYVCVAILLWALIELGLIRGTIGPNPFGPDPIAPKPAQH